MNLMDILFILLFFATLAVGFFQGMVRLLVVIVAFYLALVLASLYYPSLGEIFVRNFGTERYVGQYVAFALVLFFAFLLLAIAGLYTFRYFRMPGGLEFVDRVVGSVLGMIFGALLIGIFAALLWNLMIVRGGRNIEFPLMAALGRSIANSFVLNYFSTEVLPLVYGLLDPILPEGADLLFLV
ncbi:MAG: CvpA family protein [Chloroflexi bacterium OHK40]